MFLTIDYIQLCEHILGWELLERGNIRWKRPDGSVTLDTPQFCDNSNDSLLLKRALERQFNVSIIHEKHPLPWVRCRLLDSEGKVVAESGSEFYSRMRLEQAIARAAQKLLDQKLQVSS